MRVSQFFFKTQRSTPTDAETISHQYLVRAGFIQQVAAGIFNVLPLGWRSLNKIRAIIRDEMHKAGALEVTMPVVQPRALWEESGRADTFIPPLSTFRDRRDRAMILAPTHEETTSLMARYAINSYRDMPLRLYQIQTKFRDEPRPRGGLLRVREFEMKDAYSFDADATGMDASYEVMTEAYRNIFSRCGLNAVMVEADSGAIGGKDSAEFAVLAETGEDIVLMCDSEWCDYAANAEKAEFRKLPNPQESPLPMEKFPTPGAETIDALAQLENIETAKTAKAVFYTIDRKVHIVVIRGDYDVNETKLRNLMGGAEPRLSQRKEVIAAGFTPGSASAIGIDSSMVIVDESVTDNHNLVAGANESGFHLRNVNYGRDYSADAIGDIAMARDGYTCARIDCDGSLRSYRAIEAGHIFKLGTVYSSAMKVSFTDEDGTLKDSFMGCYGIGTGRLLAAAIEANHDDRGTLLPASIAPFEVALLGVNMKGDERVGTTVDAVYAELTGAGFEVLFDDRDEGAGAKFADADLMGMPVRVVVSSRSLARGGVEVKRRDQPPASSEICEVSRIVDTVSAALKN